MNFAFTALLSLLLALPGICFLSAYRIKRGRPQNTSLTEDLPRAICVSVIFHVLWIPLATLIGSRLESPVEPNLSAAVTLLSAQSGRDGKLFVEARDALVEGWNPIWVVVYFISISVMAGAVALLIRCLVDHFNFDRTLAIFRWNSWYYLLKGQSPSTSFLSGEPQPDMVSVAAVVGDFLYRGVLVDFVIGDSGALEAIVLTAASRRKLGDGENPEEKEDEKKHPEYYYINADNLVLKYEEISNVAISRIYIPEEGEAVEEPAPPPQNPPELLD